MAVGNNSTLDTTELMTGKDGKLFVEVNGVNTFLAEINEFKVAMNANTTEYQGVGSILVGTVPTGVTFDLTYTEAVIRDDVIMAPLLKAIQNGYFPVFNFQGTKSENPESNWNNGRDPSHLPLMLFSENLYYVSIGLIMCNMINYISTYIIVSCNITLFFFIFQSFSNVSYIILFDF